MLTDRLEAIMSMELVHRTFQETLLGIQLLTVADLSLVHVYLCACAFLLFAFLLFYVCEPAFLKMHVAVCNCLLLCKYFRGFSAGAEGEGTPTTRRLWELNAATSVSHNRHQNNFFALRSGTCTNVRR